MDKNYQVCTHCVMDTTDSNLTFDEMKMVYVTDAESMNNIYYLGGTMAKATKLS